MTRIAALVIAAAEATPAARRALLDVALAHSPRVEDGGAGVVYADVRGLRGLFGSEEALARRLAAAAAEGGLRASVAIGGSRISALVACRWRGGITVVPPGGDAAFVAPAPLACLDLDREMAVRLDRWGLRTLGDLAALSTPQLVERLGREGLALQQRARGEDPRPLDPWQPPPVIEESGELDGAVDALGSVIDLVRALAHRMAEALAARGQAVDQIEWSCRLADRSSHEGTVAPAVPVSDGRAITALVKAALEARPPRRAVEGVVLRARPLPVRPAQAAFDEPVRPGPRAISATLARVAALVGAEQLGVPVLLDTHRPDAVALDRDAWPWERPGIADASGCGARHVLALRRVRPPVPASVRLVAGRPVELTARRLTARIVRSAGPWRTSGDWWTDGPWLCDEWDVELSDATVCRLAHDGSAWWLAGIYD